MMCSEGIDFPHIIATTFMITYTSFYTHSTDCGQGFVQRGNYCYKFLPEEVTKATAAQNCLDIGAILAEPRTPDEYTAVAEVGAGGKNSFWIGLKSINGNIGPWIWDSDGQTAVWTYWHQGQPDNNDVCVYVNLNDDNLGTWRDLNCDRYSVAAVCQTEGK